jgi:hypothetical protein
VKSKSWTKANVDLHKKKSLNLKKSSPSTVRTANRFEVLYNLDKGGTQQLGANQQPLING